MVRFARGLLGVLCVGGLAIACNAIIGADEPIIDLDRDATTANDTGTPADDSGNVEDGGADPDADASALEDADAGDASDAGDGFDGFVVPNCGDASVVDPGPIYVSIDGQDTETCGTQGAPCRSIQKALAIASAIGKTVIRVGQGTYNEQLVLQAGFTIEGGWIALKEAVGFSWYGDCRAPAVRSANVIVSAPSNVDKAVIAQDLDGSAVLSTCTVTTKLLGSTGTSGQPGQSLYGVFVAGQTTDLTLKDVIVIAGSGGNGADGTNGATSGAPGVGNCPSGTGASGTTGDAGAPAPAASFDAGGFVPRGGGNGSTGGSGQNGVTGDPGTCEKCCGGGLLGCTNGTNTPSCGETGSSGCAGGGGSGGLGGQGGGASVALFVADGHVTVQGGELRTGKGGKGGNGGLGASGGSGSTGSTGGSGPICPTSCSLVACSNEKAGKGGDGSLGGSGGAGGRGGGGAGGSSYSYVVLGKGSVEVADAGLVYGAAGEGGAPNGPAGSSGPSLP
jgi:hypothetical protein